MSVRKFRGRIILLISIFAIYRCSSSSNSTSTATVTTPPKATGWARSIFWTNGSWGNSEFRATAVDSSGNVYAAGYQNSNSQIQYESTSVGNATGTGSGKSAVLVKYDSLGAVKWARTVTTGSADSQFIALAIDSSGNVYAAGTQGGTTTYTYGSGVTVAAANAGTLNSVIVKYDGSGNALWARANTVSPGSSIYYGVAVDSSGNAYAVGYQTGTGTYTYGTGVTGTGTFAGGSNVTIVKYDTSGTAIWGRTLTAGTGQAEYNAVTVDSSGNIYAAGLQAGNGTYSYAAGVNATGTYAGGKNIALVKYNSGGTALWARTVTAATNESVFYGVAADNSGNVYASGYQSGTGSFTYAAGVSSVGTYSVENCSIVKYDTNGTALWARASAGSNVAVFGAITVDSSGNAYAAGGQTQTGTYIYGTGVSVAGSYASGFNVTLVKYNSSGVAQYARSVTTGPNDSAYNSVAISSTGTVYAAGYQKSSGTYTFGTNVTVTAGAYGIMNSLIVAYYP